MMGFKDEDKKKNTRMGKSHLSVCSQEAKEFLHIFRSFHPKWTHATFTCCIAWFFFLFFFLFFLFMSKTTCNVNVLSQHSTKTRIPMKRTKKLLHRHHQIGRKASVRRETWMKRRSVLGHLLQPIKSKYWRMNLRGTSISPWQDDRC